MRSTLMLLIALMVGSPSVVGAQGLSVYCEAEGTTAYQRLACAGIHALESGEPEVAVETLQRALGTPIFEFPNFKLLVPLAIAYHRRGNESDALRSLELARITLNVFVGYYRCVEGETGTELFTRGDSRLREDLIAEATRRMCGEIYEPYYEPQPLERHLMDSQLIELFFAARREILGGPPVGR